MPEMRNANVYSLNVTSIQNKIWFVQFDLRFKLIQNPFFV